MDRIFIEGGKPLEGEVLQVVLQDARDLELVDVDLLLAHQMEQEIHRAREDRQLDAVAHGRAG